MKGINLNYAKDKSPSTLEDWKSSSENERIDSIKNVLDNHDNSWNEKFSIISAHDNGFLTLAFTKKSILVEERSKYLLDAESELCKYIDKGIVIWFSPVGDKSSLRNLRGIEIKK